MNDQINDFQKDAELNMKKCITGFQEYINKIYVGRVSPKMLDGIYVNYYNVSTPLSQLTHTIVENPRTLAITVFDQKMIKSVEKAILMSNLELNPIVFENIIRITLPVLTENRRIYLIKTIRAESEKNKISIRNVRRYVNEKIKILKKNKEINVDEERYLEMKIQKLTNFWIEKIDVIFKQKELELMTF